MPKPENTILPSSTEVADGDIILLDTSAIITAQRSVAFLNLLKEWREHGCILLTVPNVVDEFARGSIRSFEEFTNAYILLNKLHISVVSVDTFINSSLRQQLRQSFLFHYFSHAKGASVTDFQLCLTAYLMKDVKLISGNTSDIPVKYFKRLGAISVCDGNSVHTEVIFGLDPGSEDEAIRPPGSKRRSS